VAKLSLNYNQKEIRMGILDKLFKSGDISTKNSKVNEAVGILQNSSLSTSERIGALAILKSLFLTSADKDDFKVISRSMINIVSQDKSAEIRENALKTLDAIIENCLFFHNQTPPRPDALVKLNIISGYAVPALMGVAKNNNEDVRELRVMAFRTLSKIAHFSSVDNESIVFLSRSLNDPDSNIKIAVITAIENLVKSGDDELIRRIARFSLAAFCEVLGDSAARVPAARVLSDMGKYALETVPYLFKRLDDKDGEWAAHALRKITGEQYGKDEKVKWEQWLQRSIVK
jgi:hypothetical protein